MLTHFLMRALFAGIGLALAAHFVPGVSYDSVTTLMLAAVLLGVVNAVLRPVLFVLTLPLTVVTLGLFLLVLNAGMILLVSWLLKGFVVTGLVPGMLAAIITGITSWAGHVAIGDVRKGV